MVRTGVNFIDLVKASHVKSYGHSMFPVLHDGDVIYYKKKSFSKIKLDDIVIIRNNATYITHRVIYKTNKYLITKGDNNSYVDPPINLDLIIGVIEKVKRGEVTFYIDTYYLLQASIYYEYINKFIKKINDNKIPYILLKGLPLHLKYKQAYPRRRFFDFDVLVNYRDRKQICQILDLLNFHLQHNYLSKMHKKLIGNPVEETFTLDKDGFTISIDLHYEPVFMLTQIGTLNEIYPKQKIDLLSKELFQNISTFHHHNHTYNLLEKEQLVVYLALHFFHHNFKELYRLNLLISVIQSVQKNKEKDFWSQVAEIILRYNIEGYVYGSFLCVQKYYSKRLVPNWFEKKIRPKKTQCEYLKRYLLAEKIYQPHKRIKAGITLFKQLYYLSPNPWYIKMFIFVNPAVLYTFYWLVKIYIKNRIKYYL